MADNKNRRFRVYRWRDYDHLLTVDDLAYPIRALRDAAGAEVEAAGGLSPRDWPPFYGTGSPYADAILGIAERAGIKGYESPAKHGVDFITWLPSDGKEPWRASRAWGTIFNVDLRLRWFTSMQDDTPYSFDPSAEVTVPVSLNQGKAS